MLFRFPSVIYYTKRDRDLTEQILTYGDQLFLFLAHLWKEYQANYRIQKADTMIETYVSDLRIFSRSLFS